MSNDAMHTLEELQAGLAKAREALRERELASTANVLDVDSIEVERPSGR